MSVYIVSDLHIWGPEDPLYLSLLDLICGRAQSGDTLVLAGDVFDLFVGNKAVFVDRYHKFFNALRQAGQRGVQVHYIEGNHDFLLKRTLGRMAGVALHSEEVSFEIQGKRFLVAHGDLADQRDYSYRFLRAFFRSLPVRFLFWLAPGPWLESFGKWSGKKSRKKNNLLVSQLPLERRENLRKIYRSYAAERLAQGYDFMVMGHCHDLDEMSFKIGGRLGQYVNVGFPRVHGSYLSWQPGEDQIHRETLPSRIFD